MKQVNYGSQGQERLVSKSAENGMQHREIIIPNIFIQSKHFRVTAEPPQIKNLFFLMRLRGMILHI